MENIIWSHQLFAFINTEWVLVVGRSHRIDALQSLSLCGRGNNRAEKVRAWKTASRISVKGAFHPQATTIVVITIIIVYIAWFFFYLWVKLYHLVGL